MKYPYHIEYNKFGSAIMRLPEEIEHVTYLLLCDLQRGVKEFYTSHLDSVLQGKMPYAEFAGNAYRIEIRSDFTQVIDTLAEDQTNDRCLIETSELREIVDIWYEALENEPARHPQVAA